MYALRKIGFFISLLALLLGSIGVTVMLIMGVDLAGGDNAAGAIFGTIFFVIALFALIVIGMIVLLMIFYQKSIRVPLLLLIVFGFISMRLASSDTPLIYVTLGLALGPFLTVIGYFFKEKSTS